MTAFPCVVPACSLPARWSGRCETHYYEEHGPASRAANIESGVGVLNACTICGDSRMCPACRRAWARANPSTAVSAERAAIVAWLRGLADGSGMEEPGARLRELADEISRGDHLIASGAHLAEVKR